MSEGRPPVVPIVAAAALVAAGIAWYAVSSGEPEATRPAAGLPAPGFSLVNLNGDPISLEQLRGKVVYVNLWATWCGPCREEAPSLQRLYDQLHDEGFEIVAPTIDKPQDRAKVIAFREEFKLAFPIALDPQQEAYRAYGATAVPETFLVDAEGHLAESYIGPRDWDDPRYARAIRRLLAARGGGKADG